MAKRKKLKNQSCNGGAVKFLVVLPTDAIKAMKLEAIERSATGKGVTASSVLEEAVSAWIKHRKDLAVGFEERKRGKAEMRQFLSQMDAGLVRRIKKLAFDREVTASSLVRLAVAEWQRGRKRIGAS